MPVMAIGACANCHGSFGFCPECVTSIRIDPMTKRPPDVNEKGQVVTPDPEAMRRSTKEPVCPACTALMNQRRIKNGLEPWETEEVRHKRHEAMNG